MASAYTRIVRALLLLGVVAVAGCRESSGPKDVALRIPGRATVSGSGAPVAGATIRLVLTEVNVTTRVIGTTTAGADGSFDVRVSLEPVYCTHQVVVTAVSNELNAVVELSGFCAAPEQTVDLVLKPS